MKHINIDYEQLYSNKLCIIAVGSCKLYILNDFWGFGLGDNYWRTTKEERANYIDKIKKNPRHFYHNGVFIKDDGVYVASIYNNRLLGNMPDDSEESKRYQQEDIEMIAPVISLWIEEQLSKPSVHLEPLTTQLFWKHGRTLTEEDKAKIAEALG